MSNEKDWITLDLNSQGDIITSLANKLFEKSRTNKLFEGWSLSINLHYLTLTKEKNEQISDPEIIVENILDKLKSNNKKLLITIDEVTNTKDFQKFVNFYQHLIGLDYSVYLLMTGLNENINDIINDESLTFLSRAPKIELDPLSLPNIALEYMNIFDIAKEVAIKMAKFTNGYAFAYQVLGYLFYESKMKDLDENFLKKYDSYLWNNGYNKFWNDLTENEKKFVIGLAKAKDGSKNEIIDNSNLTESNFSQYRRRLIEKGLLYVEKYNCLKFVLPRFDEYVLFVKDF